MQHHSPTSSGSACLSEYFRREPEGRASLLDDSWTLLGNEPPADRPSTQERPPALGDRQPRSPPQPTPAAPAEPARPASPWPEPAQRDPEDPFHFDWPHW